MTIDSIFKESEFSSFIDIMGKDKEYDGLIAVTDFVDDEKPLWVKINNNFNILGFNNLKESTNYVTGGIYFFRKDIFEHTETAIKLNMNRLRNFLQYLIEMGVKLRAIPFSKIIDIDHKKDLIEAENFLKQSVNID